MHRIKADSLASSAIGQPSEAPSTPTRRFYGRTATQRAAYGIIYTTTFLAAGIPGALAGAALAARTVELICPSQPYGGEYIRIPDNLIIKLVAAFFGGCIGFSIAGNLATHYAFPADS